MKIEHAWACFIAIIITFSFLNNWKWEKLDENGNMQPNHYSNALKLFKAYKTAYDHYSPRALCFYSKVCSSNKKPVNKLHIHC